MRWHGNGYLLIEENKQPTKEKENELCSGMQKETQSDLVLQNVV
jgi:hypothetical protein